MPDIPFAEVTVELGVGVQDQEIKIRNIKVEIQQEPPPPEKKPAQTPLDLFKNVLPGLLP